MTSPIHRSLNIEGEIKLPNNKDKSVIINISHSSFELADMFDDDFEIENLKCERRIALSDSISREDNYTEEIMFLPDIEYIGEYDEQVIVDSFHSDDVEFI